MAAMTLNQVTEGPKYNGGHSLDLVFLLDEWQHDLELGRLSSLPCQGRLSHLLKMLCATPDYGEVEPTRLVLLRGLMKPEGKRNYSRVRVAQTD